VIATESCCPTVALIVAFASAADTAVGNASTANNTISPINRSFFITYPPFATNDNLLDYQNPNIGKSCIYTNCFVSDLYVCHMSLANIQKTTYYVFQN
jgi:hypothetical protein